MPVLKLATTNYVDSHQSDVLKGEYVYIEEPYDNRSIFKVGPEACAIEIGPGGSLTKELVINAGYIAADVTTAQVKLTSNNGDVTLKVADFMGAGVSSLDISQNIPFSINYGQNEILTVDDWDGVKLKSPSKLGIECANGSSIYINGPVQFKNSIYDKNGGEITGGTPYVWDQEESVAGPGRVLHLGQDKDGGYASVFVPGPLYIEKVTIRTDDISNGRRY